MTQPNAKDEQTVLEWRYGDRLFLGVPEFAAASDLDPRTVYRGISDGQIPAVKFGRAFRIPVPWIREQLYGASADVSTAGGDE